jgi:hypothetical protein
MLTVLVARLETFVGVILGMSYGDMLAFGTKDPELNHILFFGVLDPKRLIK